MECKSGALGRARETPDVFHFALSQGFALEGRNSPVFAKRFWKGNK